MGWSGAQRERLGMEKRLLKKYFPGRVTWIDPTGNTKVEVRMTTNNDKSYTLRIDIPWDFPNSCPEMVVCDPPSVLCKEDGSLLNMGSYTNHIWRSRDGLTRICHCRLDQWASDSALYTVFLKGRIWLEAYECQLRTGRPLSDYLQEIPDKSTRDSEVCSIL